MPNAGELRIQWINRILQHQEYEFHTRDFFVCEMHFLKEDFESNQPMNALKSLKHGSVPQIFPETYPGKPNADVILMETERDLPDSPNVPCEFSGHGGCAKAKVCKECIEKHIELMKAKDKLNSLEQNQEKMKETLFMLRQENEIYKREKEKLFQVR